MLWLRRHKPAIIKNTSAFVTVPGFLVSRFGFPNAIDTNLAAMSGLYSLKCNGWWPASLDFCGVAEKSLPIVVPLGRKLKAVTHWPNSILPNLAEAVLAGNDQTAGAFGNFCSRKNIVITLGTALVVYRIMGRRRGPYTADGCWGPYPGGGYYELATRNHGCIALDWARARLAPGRNIQFFTTLARKALVRRQEMADHQAEALFYPDAMNTKCAWVGNPEPGTRILSVFEGIGFTLKQLIEDDLGVCVPMPEIRVTGGGSANAFWLQLLADILDARVAQCAGDALYGAARIACLRASAPRENEKAVWFEPRDAKMQSARYDRWKKQRSFAVRRPIQRSKTW